MTSTPIRQAPVDPILGLSTAFNNCQASNKVNLGVGAYRDDNGKPLVFSAVQKATEVMLKSYKSQGPHNKEYLPSEGLGNFVKAARELLGLTGYTTAQAIGGTGSLMLALEFIKCHKMDFPPVKDHNKFAQDFHGTVWVSDPTWPNHYNISHNAGFQTNTYRYFNDSTLQVDKEHFKSDMQRVCPGDVVVIHGVGHNPTGADPDVETMKAVFETIAKKEATLILDVAYQGFVSGDLAEDAKFIRMSQSIKGLRTFVCQSFSKNMGMYGDRVGAVHIPLEASTAEAVISQMNLIARRIYSNPPRHGAECVSIVLNDPALRKEWESELKQVAERINAMRKQLTEGLTKARPDISWVHIQKQKGMFAYTGLEAGEVTDLTAKHHIFLASSGRISVAGLNTKNIQYVIDAITAVLKDRRPVK